jgi:hypothetical protein
MNPRDADTVTRTGPPVRVDAGPVMSRRLRPTDPWLRMDGHDASGVPAAGQPGHGRTRACDASRSASWKAGSEAATPTCSSSSAVSAVITRIWTTGRSRPGFS